MKNEEIGFTLVELMIVVLVVTLSKRKHDRYLKLAFELLFRSL